MSPVSAEAMRGSTWRSRRRASGLVLLAVLAFGTSSVARPPPQGARQSPAPLALHPENPRYFLFRGKPAVFVTSGEHYGAVLNRDFDYRRYLDELHARGFNLTRTVSGTYREVAGSFGIPGNTLAPAAGSYLCPWARSDIAGAGDGGAKFDLERWDGEYFARLRDFVAECGKRGIVVELVLFCTVYDDELWRVNPMHPRNNVQGVGPASRHDVYSGMDGALTAAQERLVRKLVTELREFDNVYYEICNEPYERAGLTREWNDRMIGAIVEAEARGPRHLIAQGIAVRSARITDPSPHVSVFNFHAATPESVALNYALGKAIADDETGGKGTGDFPYRSEAWEFLLAGGAVFSHLDFSFTVEHPGGAAEVEGAPGGGGPAIRKQIEVLKKFIESFEFVRMRPDDGAVRVAGVAGGRRVVTHALSEKGKAYAVYVRAAGRRRRGAPESAPSPADRAVDLAVDLPAGPYRAEWLAPRSGRIEKAERFEHAGGERTLASPPFVEDLALRIKRVTAEPAE